MLNNTQTTVKDMKRYFSHIKEIKMSMKWQCWIMRIQRLESD